MIDQTEKFQQNSAIDLASEIQIVGETTWKMSVGQQNTVENDVSRGNTSATPNLPKVMVVNYQCCMVADTNDFGRGYQIAAKEWLPA